MAKSKQETPEEKEARELAEKQKQSEQDQKKAAEAIAAAEKGESAQGDAPAPAPKAPEPAAPAPKTAPGDADIVQAMITAVPNCGFISLNGHRITLPKTGQKIKVPRAFVKTFPRFLSGLE